MLLRAREIYECGAPALGRYDPQVDLQSTPEAHRGLRPAGPDDAFDAGEPDEGVGGGPRVIGQDQHIDVADRLLPAAVAPRDLQPGDAGCRLQVLDQRRQKFVDFPEAEAGRVRPVVADSAEDPVLRLDSEAG